MRFLIDMGLDARLADWLRARGHDALHLRHLGMQRESDDNIPAKAIAENRVVLSCDLDFGEIVASSKAANSRVELFRLANYRLSHITERLEATLPELATRLSAGAIVTIEETRFRIRRLPILPAGDDE